MPEQLSLSLQAFPTVDKDKESLKYLISRINQQKGSFRNVTEQSLEEEILAQETGGSDADDQDVVETVEEGENVKTKQEEVIKAREDIIKQAGYDLGLKTRMKAYGVLGKPITKAPKPSTSSPSSSLNMPRPPLRRHYLPSSSKHCHLDL